MSRTLPRRPLPALAAALGLALMLAAPAALAADDPIQRTIVVNGVGEVSATPDRAHVSAGVVSQAPTAAAALTANNTAMARVMETLRGANILPQNIQTSNFSVSPQYEPFRPDQPQPMPQRIIGYQVSNQVTVMVDDLARLGTVLDALVRAGANQLGGISFSFRDPKPLAEGARREAVEDAAAKARTLAAAAGVTLGPVISIQEGGGGFPIPRPMAFEAAQARDVAIAPGESTVSINVSMTYAIQ
jgi:uncharacterized protein YggE